MNEEFVSFEQAVALKECGFDMSQWRGENYVEKIPGTEKEEWDDEECQWVTTYDINLYPKLRLDQAQKWLREIHGIGIYVIPHSQNAYEVAAKRLGKAAIDTFFVFDLWDSSRPYPTYEAALSAGLDAALGLIAEMTWR